MRGRMMADEDDGVNNGVVWMEEDTQTSDKRTKGRGFKEVGRKIREEEEEEEGNLSRLPLFAPLRSVEGWIIMVSGVHEEAQEDDLHNVFADYGELKNLHINIDRRTGHVKGYALIEYDSFEAAQTAISSLNGARLFGEAISVDWAFRKAPARGRRSLQSHHSRSPRRRY